MCIAQCGAEVPLLPSSELPRGSEDVRVTPPLVSSLRYCLSQELLFLLLPIEVVLVVAPFVVVVVVVVLSLFATFVTKWLIHCNFK